QALPCLNLLETFIAESPPDSESEPAPDFRFRKTLSLEGAFFRYPSSPGDSLSDITLTIAKGEKIGLIGPSGAGKSTLALLFSGLVAPREGQFRVDGRVMTPPEQTAYLQKIGFVPQSPMLMGGTVADNVAFSRWGREYDREEVLEACRLAAMDFVLNDPKGIDKMLSEGGGGLSGGQAQRVAIARALFTKPDIIIFDEATSALDQASENIIADTIAQLPGETTVFIIAHRLTTVAHCDRLIWVEGGRLRDQGPPEVILPQYEKVMSGAGLQAVNDNLI
ncbi:MAG: ATP-binding cassette domain-containing protein, partial [Candidatus Adiutrix sp.]|nr:ATP-binding cassette domain-containing protein [Candidatus Adiutrix sp.]